MTRRPEQGLNKDAQTGIHQKTSKIHHQGQPVAPQRHRLLFYHRLEFQQQGAVDYKPLTPNMAQENDKISLILIRI